MAERSGGRGETQGPWGDAWREYTQRSTIQGLDKLTDDTPFAPRKCIWLLIVAGCMTMFIVQTTMSVMYYYTYPVSVNVKINHNTSLLFPAVTICNQNAFRTTRAASLDWYRLISEMFHGEELNRSVALDHYDASHITLRDLYEKAGHDKYDLIMGCEWKSTRCGPEDFTTTMTDHGLCFTFNSQHNISGVLATHKTGAGGGLRLRLNIEQYEYMPGPNSGAGLKVLVHFQHEVPQIRDLGLSIPPGSHSVVGVTTIKLYDREPPYGECDWSKESQYFHHYTVTTCQIECRQRYLAARCGCRDVFMPEMPPDYPAFCNLTQYINCYLPTMRDYEETGESATCSCTIPCERTLFESSVSYGTTSNFDTENFLRTGNLQKIRQSFVHARETVQRVDENIVQEDTWAVMRLHSLSLALNDTFDSIQGSMNNLKAKIQSEHERLRQRVAFHEDRGVTAVRYIVEHDFLRGWEVMEERGINHVTTGFYETIDGIDSIMSRLNSSNMEPGERTVLYLIGDKELRARQNQAERAFSNITQTHHAYMTGEPLLTYRLTKDRRYDMKYIPKDILKFDEVDETYHFYHLTNDTQEFLDSVRQLRRVLKIVLNTRTIDNETAAIYEKARKDFVAACRGYNYRRFQYRDRVVIKPLELVNERIDHFHSLNATLHARLRDVWRVVDSVKDHIEVTKVTTWSFIQGLVRDAIAYIQTANNTKSALASNLTHAGVYDATRSLSLYFSTLRHRSRELSDLLTKLYEAFLELWRNMLEEGMTKEIYAALRDDVIDLTLHPEKRSFYIAHFAYLLRVKRASLSETPASDFFWKLNADFPNTTVSDKEAQYQALFRQVRANSNINGLLDDKDQAFLQSFQGLQESLQVFLDGNRVNFDFIKNNLLQMDVYMKELSYEEIHQEIAYGRNNLASDIGGNVGLWVGATVVTVFEIIDFFLHNMLKIHLSGRPPKKKPPPDIYSQHGAASL